MSLGSFHVQTSTASLVWTYLTVSFSILLLLVTYIISRFSASQTLLQRFACMCHFVHMYKPFSRMDSLKLEWLDLLRLCTFYLEKICQIALQKCRANSSFFQNYEAIFPHCCQYWGFSVTFIFFFFFFPHQRGRHCISLLFSLHSSDYHWCWGSFHMFNAHLDFFCELSAFLFMCQFFWWLNCSLVMSILLSGLLLKTFLT